MRSLNLFCARYGGSMSRGSGEVSANAEEFLNDCFKNVMRTRINTEENAYHRKPKWPKQIDRTEKSTGKIDAWTFRCTGERLSSTFFA